MPQYVPLNYGQINLAAGTTSPSQVKSFNNKTYAYWERSLFQRACSVLTFEVPDTWDGSVKDFFYYCLFKFGYVAVFERDETGLIFQPCSLYGYDIYYQPTEAIISNPKLNVRLKIHDECELIKLSPDFMGIWDTISYYAEKLSTLDNAINMSIINNKFAYILGARNKASAEALKKIMDKINRGEPAVIYDKSNLLHNDAQDKGESPFQFLERTNLKNSYLTTDQLNDFQTILNNFDAEVGIPTIPYQKKERLVQSEAESRVIDSTSRSIIWKDTIDSSLKLVNDRFNTNITCTLRYDEKEVEDNEQVDTDKS